MKKKFPEASAAFAAALGTILVASGAWLLVPREREGAKPTLPALRVCLVDVSPSAVWRRKDWTGWIERTLAEQAESADRAEEDLCTILYGSEVRRDFGPLPAHMYPQEGSKQAARFREAFSFIGESETRLTAALEAARTLARDPARAASRVVILSDRTYTGNDPVPLLGELRDIGITVEWIDLPPPDRAEIAFGPLSMPRRVEPGAPIVADAEVFYAPGAGNAPLESLTIDVVRKSASGFESRNVAVTVPRGLVADPDGYLRWRVRLEIGDAAPGLNTIRLEGSRSISVTDHDTEAWSEGVVRCSGRLVLGIVTGEHRLLPFDRPREILASSSGEGLQIESLWPEELASRLDALDALVTCDVRPDQLPSEVLSSFVEHGGGWLCLAGDGFLPGFVPGTNVSAAGAARLMPLTPPPERPEPRDVVVLVDRSGSMAGEPLENVRRAVLALVEAAPARDAVELRFFGEHLSEVISLKAVEDPRDVARIVREASDRFQTAVGPGGSTAIARSLEAFAADRESSGRESLDFLLTDGRDTVDADAKERCAKVLPRLTAARARLVVIGAGDEPDRDLLRGLVAVGEELHTVGSLASASWPISQIFRRELTTDRVRQGDSLRVLASEGLLSSTAPASLGADILRAQNPDSASSWPTIQRFARAKAATGAEVLWSSEKGEPLLAIHRVGLGAAAACAFAPIERWGSDWAKRMDLWAPLLRTLARGRRELTPTVRVEGDELTVEDLPVDAPAELEARFFTADAKPGDAPAAVLVLSPPTQGADPRRVRSGHWPRGTSIGPEDLRSDGDTRRELGVVDPSFPRVEIRARGDAASKWPALELPFAPPHAPEFVLPRPRLNAGDLFAPRPGSEPSAPPKPLAGRSLRAHPAAPWVLFSGLLLLTLAGLGGFFSRRAR